MPPFQVGLVPPAIPVRSSPGCTTPARDCSTFLLDRAIAVLPTDILLDIDRESVVLLDVDLDLPCEGTHHIRGLSGHQPTAPGAYLAVSPCCGSKVVQCTPRVLAMRASGVLYCGACRGEHLTSEYTFTPL